MEKFNKVSTTITIIMEPFRFLLYTVQSGMQFHPFRGKVSSALQSPRPYPTEPGNPPYAVQDTSHAWSAVDGA